jgi:hypothetical protein
MHTDEMVALIARRLFLMFPKYIQNHEIDIVVLLPPLLCEGMYDACIIHRDIISRS